MFFVLSGFLITTLLAEEWNRDGRINLVAFYGRRARRLLPALAVVLVVVLIVWRDPWQIAAVGLYVGNWVRATGVDDLGPLGHTWSLAIEEQFYLVWPALLILVLPFVRSWRVAAGVLAIVAVTLIVGRVILWSPADFDRWAFATDSHAPALLLGSAAALAMIGGFRIPRPDWFLAAGVLILVPIVVVPFIDLGHRYGFGFAAVGSVLILLGLLERPLLTWRPLVGLGVISYGVYLWHFVIRAATPAHPAVQLFLVVPLAIGIALASYLVVERRFVRRRSADPQLQEEAFRDTAHRTRRRWLSALIPRSTRA